MGEPDGFGLYSLKGSGTNGFADLRTPDRSGKGALPLKRTRAVLVAVPAIGLIALATLGVLAVVGRRPSHSVILNWRSPMPVKGVTVVGYNVYRSVTMGGPYARIASSVTGLTYHDSIVNNTKTYYYVVTSVDAAGHESTYSTEAQAKIP